MKNASPEGEASVCQKKLHFLTDCRGQRSRKVEQLDPDVYVDTRVGRVVMKVKTPCVASIFAYFYMLWYDIIL